MPSSVRREFLRTTVVLSAAGLAGCLGGRESSGTASSPTAEMSRSPTSSVTTVASDSETSPSPTPAGEDASLSVSESSVKTVAGHRVGVTDPVARKAVAYDSIMGSGGVLARQDRQFVVAAVQSVTDSAADAAGPPPYDAFDLVVDGDAYPAVAIEKRTRGAFTTSLAGRGDVKYDEPYARPSEDRVGWVAFELPSPLAASSLAIRCRYEGEAARWRLPRNVAATLARRPPSFELRSFAAESLDAESVELSLSVENVADVGGRFLAAVYWPTAIADDDESHLVRERVPANGRVEWSTTVDAKYAASSNGETTATVDGCVSGTATVPLSGTTTA
ncbi:MULTISPECIES: hypothetical protein [Halorussus]|uniref:hypothetical protein n=1 Tax=Halorussus TaxID=1070314 RepID=UPI0020A1971E|nr:hypothetical protein [Halorussus vallis]USZ78181.1 hypothetical protein NGM07_21225 [Halorussus vallis]